MGKAEIVSGGADGYYTINLVYNKDQYDNQIAIIDARISDLQTKYTAETDSFKKALMNYEIIGLQKRKSYLETNYQEKEQFQAWCADLTEDLTGDVGTVEIPNEKTNVLIQPGYDGNAAYNSSRDGQLFSTITTTAAQTYYNLAMLPGWQKWKPLFRFGTITAIDGNNADVTMESATSSQQSLDVNQSTSLTNVAIEYMDCDGFAFEVGDEVLVKFEGQDWNTPKIVGFKDNPKPCFYRFYIKPKMNGNYATKGREQIRIDYTLDAVDNDETKITYGTQYPTSFENENGLAGPFQVEGKVRSDSLDVDVSLHWRKSDSTYVFHAFYVGDAGNYTYQLGSDAEYVKQITQKKTSEKLFDLSKTTVTVDGEEFDVYEAPFTELYVQQRSPDATTQANQMAWFDLPTALCTIVYQDQWIDNDVITNYEFPVLDGIILNDPVKPSTGSWDDGLGSYVAFINYVWSRVFDPAISWTHDYFVIITDTDGNNPTHSNITRELTNRKEMQCGEYIDDVFYEYTYENITENWQWTFEMIETPSDRW